MVILLPYDHSVYGYCQQQVTDIKILFRPDYLNIVNWNTNILQSKRHHGLISKRRKNVWTWILYLHPFFEYVIIPQPTYICMNKGSDNQIHGRKEQGEQQDELESDHPFHSCYINAYKQKSINSYYSNKHCLQCTVLLYKYILSTVCKELVLLTTGTQYTFFTGLKGNHAQNNS